MIDKLTVLNTNNGKKIKMDRLDKAIAAFEDENSDLSLGERLSNLRLALQWAAFNKLKRTYSKGSKTDQSEDELDFKLSECMKQFKIMEQMYYSQLKQNKASGKAADDGMDKDFLKKIKKEKGSMGDIVRDLRPSDN